MRQYDLTPFYRSFVGLERMNDLINAAAKADGGSAYPPYNIEIVADNAYRIELAVAGFTSDQLAIESKENTLTITGEKPSDQPERKFAHRGLAERNFRHVFQLADYVRVEDAKLENGLLILDLVRELPEAMKPRKIAIKADVKSELIEA